MSSTVVSAVTKTMAPSSQKNEHLLQQRRGGKHSSKMAQHLIRLDEMAHEKQHEEAVAKRKKKKEKKAARKSKNIGKASSENMDATKTSTHLDVDDMEGEWHEEEEEEEEEEDEAVLPDTAEVRERMKKIVAKFEESLKAIRGVEPTAELFDDVRVDAYGSKTSLKSVAQVIISSPTLAIATCFDPAVAKSVSTAIIQQLEFIPSVEEGGVVKIPLPRMSLESRQNAARALGKRAENYRQRVRQVRQKVLRVVKQGVAGRLEHVSKDDAFRVENEIEAITREMIQALNEAAEKKHNSIVEVS